MGVATSAFQVEGATRADERGPSIWDTFAARPGTIADDSTANRACDHYHLVERDLDLLQSLGVTSYRFSVAWPRVMPRGRGAVNTEGLGFYDRLVDGLAARGHPGGRHSLPLGPAAGAPGRRRLGEP